ncbi:MAG: hypothetical protein AAFR56_04900 [Chloroflexota bacterium]
MRSVLFTTAEYASVSNDGKLSLMGIFDSIQAATFPAASPRMYLVAQFKAEPDEYGRIFEVMFQLHNSNGDTLIQLSGAGEVPDSEHNLSVLMNQVVTLNNVSFEAPGDYVFTAHIDGTEAARLPFVVVAMKKPNNQV